MPAKKENNKDSVNEIFKKLNSIEDSTSKRSDNKDSFSQPITDNPTYTPITLSYRAFKRMVGYAIRYANERLDSKKWKEVYGILVGTIKENKFAVVKDAIPVCVGERSGVELEPIHYVDLSEIDASIYDRAIEDKKTDFIIGWWHTHPGFGFFFSGVDRETQLGYQELNSFAVGLIFDHCQKSSDSLGVAALRLKNPQRGILSKDLIVKINYDLEVKNINQKIKKVIAKIQKNMNKILRELKYIHNFLDNKLLTNLQKEYGLLLIPKKKRDDLEEEELEKEQYIWELDFYKSKYKKSKFRKKIEMDITNYKEILLDLRNKNQIDTLKEKQKEYVSNINNMLSKPNKLYSEIIEDFIRRIDIINPYYDYLDSDERKIIETFEKRLNKYYEILNQLNQAVIFLKEI